MGMGEPVNKLTISASGVNIADSIEHLEKMLSNIVIDLASIDTEIADETRYKDKVARLSTAEIGPGTLADIQGMIVIAEDIQSYVSAIDRKLGRSQSRNKPITASLSPLPIGYRG